jgi:hypothetical protein
MVCAHIQFMLHNAVRIATTHLGLRYVTIDSQFEVKHWLLD